MSDEPQSPLKPNPVVATADPFDPVSFGGQASSAEVAAEGFGNFDDFAGLTGEVSDAKTDAEPAEKTENVAAAPEVNVILDEDIPDEKPPPKTPTPSPIPSPAPSPVPALLGAATELIQEAAAKTEEQEVEQKPAEEEKADQPVAVRATPSPVLGRAEQEELLPGFGVGLLAAVDVGGSGDVCLLVFVCLVLTRVCLHPTSCQGFRLFKLLVSLFYVLSPPLYLHRTAMRRDLLL